MVFIYFLINNSQQLLLSLYDFDYITRFPHRFSLFRVYGSTIKNICQSFILLFLVNENVKFFCNIFSKKIFNIVYLLFIIYNDIIRLQLQLFLSSFLKKCIEKRLSSGSHFLYAPLSFILLIFPFH